jgi:hypothetical protein
VAHFLRKMTERYQSGRTLGAGILFLISTTPLLQAR